MIMPSPHYENLFFLMSSKFSLSPACSPFISTVDGVPFAFS